MSLLHSSTRRPSPLRDIDYDHEINLVDRTRSHSASPRPGSPDILSDSSSRRHSDTPLRKPASSLRKEFTKRKFSKYQDRHLGEPDDGQTEGPRVDEDVAEERGRPRDSATWKNQEEPESAIDILYENQRGWFMCGIPLFSGRALVFIAPIFQSFEQLLTVRFRETWIHHHGRMPLKRRVLRTLRMPRYPIPAGNGRGRSGLSTIRKRSTKTAGNIHLRSRRGSRGMDLLGGILLFVEELGSENG